MSKQPTLKGTVMPPEQIAFMLEKVWTLLCELDAFLDLKTEWEEGALGIEDIAPINACLAGLTEWLDSMDDNVHS